jgi:ribose transport system substrate-binding protein
MDRKRRRQNLVRGLLALAAVLCGSCSREVDINSGTGPKPARKIQLAVIPQSTGGEFWETVETGARRAAAELDVEIRWEGTVTETEIAEQNKIIENMVNLGVDGIAVAPLNYRGTKQAVQNAVRAGIPVVVFDSAVEGDAHSSFVATDNRQGGVLAAEHMSRLISTGERRVMVARFVQGSAGTEERADGFIEAARRGGLEIVADPYPDTGTVEGCKTTAANTLERFIKGGKLELDGIFACNLYSTLGVLFALSDLRKTGVEVSLRFVGFDTSPRLVQEMVGGAIDGLVVQNAEKMGYLAVQTVYKVVRGEEVEPLIDTGVEFVTKERWTSEPGIRELMESP